MKKKNNSSDFTTFLGSGTMLIECKRLGRHGIGIELLPSLVKRSKELVDKEANPYNVVTQVIEGDSCLMETVHKVEKLLQETYNKRRDFFTITKN